MRRELLEILRDPATGSPLELEVCEEAGGEVQTGTLRAGDRWYPVHEEVPRLLLGALRTGESGFPAEPTAERESDARDDPLQATRDTFSDKWRRFRSYGFAPEHREFLHGWFADKLGLSSAGELPEFYAGMDRILEVGPGSGFNTRFMGEHCAGLVLSADLSDAALTTHENTRDLENVHVVQADLMSLPCADDLFDFAIADGVLHHTPDTRSAMEAVYRKVRPGGRFFFYVYKQMGPAREFCDRELRAAFSQLPPEQCYEACEGLTELGRELSRLDARVTLGKGVPELGIPAGEHDVQRLLYYSFLKCFWNEAFDWETNNMVNFDWYHPHFAWKHTEEEVAGWLVALGVTEYAFHPANPNGISCLLRKPA